MNGSPDSKLVRQARGGDKGAFTELFARYEGRIFGYVYRMVGERDWAEDIAQEAFIRAHQKLGRLGPPYDFKSWVYRIASNLAIDELRRRREEVPLPDWDAGEASAPEPADRHREGHPEEQAEVAEVRDRVWRALHQLPDSYREVLLLREMEGLSYGEIASAAGISLDNVKVTLHRARLRFRDLYGVEVMIEEGRGECRELDELLSAFVDGELDRKTRKRVKDHIASCPECQEKQRELTRVGVLLGVLAPVYPPTTLSLSFRTRLADAPAPDRLPESSGGAGGGAGGSAVARGMGGGWTYVLVGGSVIVFAGVVALGLLLAARAGIFGGAAQSPPPTPTSHVAPPPATPTSTPSPPVPTRTPSPAPSPQIAFSATPNPVQAGDCLVVQWHTTGVDEVYFEGEPASRSGSLYVCPCADRTFTLDVVLPDGSHDIRHLAVHVEGQCVQDTATPTPDLQPPPAPVLLEPVDRVPLSCRSTVTLRWAQVSDPSGVGGYYVWLEEEVMGRAAESWQWGPLAGTERIAQVQCGVGYRWAVRAEDAEGNLGPWSEFERFSVQQR
jgi:RNA polymerase sigma-70 factor (ECF subfamily)